MRPDPVFDLPYSTDPVFDRTPYSTDAAKMREQEKTIEHMARVVAEQLLMGAGRFRF